MTSKTIKELWRVEGKYNEDSSRVKNILYGYSGNPLVPYCQNNIEPDYCIFAVVDKKGTETGWLFKNDNIGGKRISELLRNFIKNGGEQHLFYGYKNRARTDNNQKVNLCGLIYSFRYGTTVERAKELQVRMISNSSCSKINDTEVFDLTWDNLISNEKFSATFITGKGDRRTSGSILHGENTLCVYLPERKIDKDTGEAIFIPRYFTTSFSPDLCYVLNKITNSAVWIINKGALMAVFSRARKKQIYVSFAEIIWAYDQGRIDISRPIESIIENHTALMGSGDPTKRIIIDHLTHNKENNFPWALAPIPEVLNKQMQCRDKIKPPYFFLTAYDHTINKYKLKLGCYGLWERRYLFDTLAYQNDENDVFLPQYRPVNNTPEKGSLYVTIYAKFKEKIGAGNLKAKTSYLSYWADVERTFDPDNMYTIMVDEPNKMYRPALEAWLDDGQGFDNVPEI